MVGGEGADTIALQDDDDTFDAYDGFADVVDCGTGNDSGFASDPGVDTLTDCETADLAPNTAVAGGPADGSTTDSQTPTYELTASEGGVTFQLSVDHGGFTSCGASCQVPALSEGQHSLRFRAVESAGAQRPDPTPAQRTLTVDAFADPPPPGPTPPTPDKTPPDTAIGKTKVKGDKVQVRFTSTEQNSTFICKLDRKKARPCASPTTHRKLDEGKHKVKVTATDAAANADPTPATGKFQIG